MNELNHCSCYSTLRRCNSERTRNLGNGSVVPNVAFVRENVCDEPQLALLHILLNGVQEVFSGNLRGECTDSSKLIGEGSGVTPNCCLG